MKRFITIFYVDKLGLVVMADEKTGQEIYSYSWRKPENTEHFNRREADYLINHFRSLKDETNLLDHPFSPDTAGNAEDCIVYSDSVKDYPNYLSVSVRHQRVRIHDCKGARKIDCNNGRGHVFFKFSENWCWESHFPNSIH